MPEIFHTAQKKIPLRAGRDFYNVAACRQRFFYQCIKNFSVVMIAGLLIYFRHFDIGGSIFGKPFLQETPQPFIKHREL